MSVNKIASRNQTYAKNIFINWGGYALNLAILFWISPFLVEGLGDDRYGVLMLLGSLTGYLSLADAGAQAGLGRFLNYYFGKNKVQEFNETFNTGIAMFIGTGVILSPAGFLIATNFTTLFPKIPLEISGEASITVLLVTFNLWLSFLSLPMRLALQAKERFDLIMLAQVASLTLRTALYIVAINNGGKLIAITLANLAATVVGVLVETTFAIRFLPQIKFSRLLISRQRLTEISRFSAWAFIATVAYRVVSSTDIVLVSIFFTPELITLYAVGEMLSQKMNDVITRTSFVFNPKMMQSCASDKITNVASQFLLSAKICGILSVLLGVGCVIFGDTFIRLWMGDRFEQAKEVLILLVLGCAFSAQTHAALPVFSGLGHIKIPAILNTTQMIGNLILSLAFLSVMKSGIEGVAFASLIVKVVIGALGPLWALALLRGSFIEYMKIQVRLFFGAVCFFASCSLIDRSITTNNWTIFIFKVNAAVIAFAIISFSVFLDRKQRHQAFKRLMLKQLV